MTRPEVKPARRNTYWRVFGMGLAAAVLVGVTRVVRRIRSDHPPAMEQGIDEGRIGTT